MRRPTSVDPVKLIPPTRASWINASPATLPDPVIRFTTPGGRPALSSRCIRYTADQGVSMAGLNTTVFPQARAGAIFRTGVTTGKFHGLMVATTPSGSATVWQDRPARSLG